MATSNQIIAIVLSPCELYQHAWKSVLASLVFVNVVQTTATVSEITLPSGGGKPMAILVDVPGSEHHLALRLGPFYDRCKALFVVNDYDLRTILPLLRLGVTGFTARGDPVSNFEQALLATVKGQIGLPQGVANHAMAELANGHRRQPTLQSNLTRRESEVLHLLADGMSNRDIAQKMFLSVRTVEAHLRNLYGKLDVNSRTEAAIWAVRHGYVPFIE